MFESAPEARLFAIADGLGARNAGEIALPLAIDGNRLRTAIHLANRRVFRLAESHDDYNGSRDNVTALVVRDEGQG